jgi:N4-gp56 family major capsid protein
MATTYTGITGGTTVQTPNFDLLTQTAYDRAVAWYLNDVPQWRAIVDKRPVNQAMPGDVVTFSIHNQLTLPTSAAAITLSEQDDPDATSHPAPTQVNVSLAEYGKAVIGTLRLQQTAFNQPLADLARSIAYHMSDSIDTLVRLIADTSTNLLWVNAGAVKMTGGADNSVVATDLLLRAPATVSVKRLRSNKVTPREGNDYIALIHPDVSYDLQAENSATAWVGPHVYGTDTAAVYAGEVGRFQGARYIETTRTRIQANSVPVNVYSTYYFGREAIAEATAVEPHVVIGPQVDKLRRFNPIGWYSLQGWGLYRPKSMLTARTASSIGTIN